jgi:hypothetical protein
MDIDPPPRRKVRLAGHTMQQNRILGGMLGTSGAYMRLA